MHPDVQTHGLDVSKEVVRTRKNDTLRNLSREAPSFAKRRQVIYMLPLSQHASQSSNPPPGVSHFGQTVSTDPTNLTG